MRQLVRDVVGAEEGNVLWEVVEFDSFWDK